MALLSQQLQRLLVTRGSPSPNPTFKTTKKSSLLLRARCCSAIAIDAPPPSLTGAVEPRWGLASLQGPREEMEDHIVLQPNCINGLSYAAVFDGHAGSSSVKFLSDELHKECVAALQGGLLLGAKDFTAVRVALEEAFQNADAKLLNWLEKSGDEVESGSTATVLLVGNDELFISHVGDSSVVLSRSGKAEVLTSPHRPYGNHKVSLQEIKRVREAGGWIVNGRICGDISVSRAFGDLRFKTRKNEMLEKGVEEGRWPQKFISRVQFIKDLVVATPDVFKVSLGSDSEFVLLASDGLWDYMSSSDAVSFVRSQLQQHGDVQVACQELARAALDRCSQDNVSIVIADLGQTDWQNLPLQQQNPVYELSQAFATVGIVLLGIWASSLLSL